MPQLGETHLEEGTDCSALVDHQVSKIATSEGGESTPRLDNFIKELVLGQVEQSVRMSRCPVTAVVTVH